MTVKQVSPFIARVWDLERWERGAPRPAAFATQRRHIFCAAGPGHRKAIARRWERDKRRYNQHRHRQLARHNINHQWQGAFYPSSAWEELPQLPPYVIAALAEKAGDVLGVDVPGWTMAQMTIGESYRKPGSAGVDPGGTRGFGLWAVTTGFSFNDELVARFDGVSGPPRYEAMWNPVKNSAAMALILGSQGTGAWYGDRGVTCWDCHYRGHFDLRLVLGGLSFRKALRLGT